MWLDEGHYFIKTAVHTSSRKMTSQDYERFAVVRSLEPVRLFKFEPIE